MKINILDKSIFTKIAAGEVVERPASVVKELVENSIDAQATQITIEISEGGIAKIKVTDNGIGMEAEDLPRAFMPHATSKISTVDDLGKIGTLGFRGEALSSIASVAKITAISKTESSELGNKIEIHGGEVLQVSQVGSSNGTSILVEELFYCIPARAKFLKKPKLEESEITNVVSRLIMAHPNVNFKYVVEGKIVFLSPGTGLKDAIYAVYGKSASENLLEVNFAKDIFTITGYIGKPTFTKPNRTYQTLIINGRYVVNQTISTAVYKAYEGFLMKGNFPFFVLNLQLPLERVDVNVHPNKLDVKFEDSSRIFGLFLHAISNCLFENSHMKQLEREEDEFIFIKKQEPMAVSLPQNEGKSFEPTVLENKNLNEIELTNNSYFSPEYEQKKNSLNFFLNDDSLENLQVKQDGGFSDKLIKQALETNNLIQPNEVKTQNLFAHEEHKIIGILFHTYIIVEAGDFAYFIDQHAAHERILYDKFKALLQNKELTVQQLLVPYILDVNYMESEWLQNNLENFKELGFEIENFGINSFKVNTVPVLFKDISIHSFFTLVLKDIQNALKVQPFNIMEAYLARSACRTAIKANDIISSDEIEILLTNLNKTNQVLLCPHGRPVVVKVPKTDLEKWFKRIV